MHAQAGMPCQLFCVWRLGLKLDSIMRYHDVHGLRFSIMMAMNLFNTLYWYCWHCGEIDTNYLLLLSWQQELSQSTPHPTEKVPGSRPAGWSSRLLCWDLFWGELYSFVCRPSHMRMSLAVWTFWQTLLWWTAWIPVVWYCMAGLFCERKLSQNSQFRVIRIVMVLLQKPTWNRCKTSVLSCDLVTNFQHTDSELPKLDTVYQKIFAAKKIFRGCQ